MPRELEGYRPQLELLTDMFPGRAAIGITECQAALVCECQAAQIIGGHKRKGLDLDAQKLATQHARLSRLVRRMQEETNG